VMGFASLNPSYGPRKLALQQFRSSQDRAYRG
jgi:hypothetical protein